MPTSSSCVSAGRWRKPFFTIWLGQSFSLFGSMIVQFALIWWLTNTTGSARVLATASIVGLVPTIIFSPFAGALVDRWERRKVLIFADGAIAATTLSLAVLSLAGVMQPWQVYLALFLRSFFGAFHWPAMQASIPLMVPHVHLARIKGMDNALYGILRIVAPPIGALLLVWLPLPGVLMVDVVTAIIAISAVLLGRVPQPTREDAVSHVTARLMWADLRSGINYLFKSKGLTIIVMMGALVNVLVVPIFTLLPIWVTRFYNGGPFELGWIESATGLGIIAGGVLLTVWGGFKKRIYTSLYGLLGLALACILTGVVTAEQFTLAMFSVGAMGMMLTLVQGPMLAVVQDVVPPELQGRVLTILDSATSAASPIGLIIAGFLGDARTPQIWFLVAGVGFALLLLIASLSGHVRNVEDELPKA
ncbi:MAG: MFS transporter, partial [Chloroflexi bacterium]|nr:MFS transporter [Chloroflexota bacterium]